MYLVYLCVFISIVLLNRWRLRGKIKLYEKFKTNVQSWPIIGHGLWFMGTNEDRMNTFKMCGEEAMKNGGIASFWLANYLYLVVADHQVAEIILKTTAEKNDIAKFIRMLIGNGILFAPAAIWRPRRKILAPTFSQKNLNNFVSIFSKQSRIMVDKLENVAGKGDFPIWKYITCYTMDSVCESTLGYDMNSQSNPHQPFFQAFEKCCRMVVDRMVQPWLYSAAIYRLTPYHAEFMSNVKYLQTFVNQIVIDKRKQLKENTLNKDVNSNEESKSDMKSFLELLITSSGGDKGYSDIELQEETLVLVLGGTDTSAVGISFTILMLAKHPEVQEKVYQEIIAPSIYMKFPYCPAITLCLKSSNTRSGIKRAVDRLKLQSMILEVFGDSDRPLTHEDIPRLKYLDAVIKESLRLYPPVPVLIPGLDRDIILPSGVTIPSDTGIILNIYSIHHSPKFWGDDVEEFKPERFIDALPNPAYMPFSTGLRTCIGYRYTMMSITTAISTLLRSFKVLPSESMRNDKPLRLKFEVMMKDVDNFQVQLELRKKMVRNN